MARRPFATAVNVALLLVSMAVAFALLEQFVVRVLERDPLMQPIAPEDLLTQQPGCGKEGWDGRLLGCDAALDPAEKQILILGDSFAAGAGGLVQESFSYQLRFAGFRTRNCAVQGYDLRRILGVFEEQSQRYRPAITVYAMVLNDFNDVPASQTEPPVLAASHPDATGVVDDYIMFRTRNFQAYLNEHASQFGPLERLLATTHVGSWLLRKKVLRDIGRRVEAGYRAEYQPRPELDAAFDDIARMAEKTDHLLVMIFPLFEKLRAYPFEEPHRVIRAALAQRHVEYLDLIEVFRGQNEDELIVCPTDHHPNARGHAMTAQALREKLTQLGWVTP